MRNSLLKATVLSTLVLASTQVTATGLVALPTTGFSVGSDTSPYTLCNMTGDFGSAPDGDINETQTPTTTANNTCAVFPTSASTSPVSGYSLVAQNTSSLDVNDAAHTNNTNIKVGTLRTYLWRNTTTNMCIVGARVTSMTANDYDLNTPGVQNFSVNDVAFGGFAAHNGSSTVSAGYYTTIASGNSVAYRIGRTFTAVQHRPSAGYIAQPLTTSAPTPPGIPGGTINGLIGAGTPTAAQQAAALSANWVNFTTDAGYDDPDGSSITDGTALFYVEASCPAATYTSSRVAGALRFRQSGQETGDLIEISVPGYVPGSDVSVTTY